MTVVRCVDRTEPDCFGWVPPPSERLKAQRVPFPREGSDDFLWVTREHDILRILLRDYAELEPTLSDRDRKEFRRLIERLRKGELCDQLLCQRYRALRARHFAREVEEVAQVTVAANPATVFYCVTLMVPSSSELADVATRLDWLMRCGRQFLEIHTAGSAWRIEIAGSRDEDGVVTWKPHLHAVVCGASQFSSSELKSSWVAFVRRSLGGVPMSWDVRSLADVRRMGEGRYVGARLEEQARRLMRYTGKSTRSQQRRKKGIVPPTALDQYRLWLDVEWLKCWDTGKTKQSRRMIWCGRTGLFLERNRHPAA